MKAITQTDEHEQSTPDKRINHNPWILRLIIILVITSACVIYFYWFAIADQDIQANADLVTPDVPQPLVEASIRVDPLAEIRPQLTALTNQQIILQKHLDEQATVAQRQQQTITTMQDSLTALSAQLEAQKNQLLTRNKTISTRLAKRRLTPALQLTLASIDQWGDDDTAVFNYQHQLVTLRQGERFQDWTLTTIDRSAQQVKLVNDHNKPMTLRLQP